MTTTFLPRRAVVGAVLATSLIGGGLAVAFADDAAPTGGCPTWTDPKGDSTTGSEPTGLSADANLDIVSASLSPTADKLIATVTTDGLGDGPSDAGDEIGIDFTVAGADLYIAGDREVDGSSSARVGSYSDPTVAEDATVVYDTKTKTVTITAPLASVKAAAGADVVGKPATGLNAYTADIVPGADIGLFTYDDAATKATTALGVDCGSGGAAVTPVDVPVPSASPAASPVTLYDPAADPSKLPRKECFLAKDPKGDGTIDGAAPNDPDLDLTNATLGADAKNLYAYLRVDKLAAGPAIHDGHRFYVNFTFNKHTFTAAGSAYKNAQSGDLKDGLAQTGQVAHVTQLAVDGVSSATDPERVTGNGPGFVESGLKFVFDTKASVVTAILPVADVEKYGKAPLAGATLTGVYFGSYGDSYAVATGADQLPDGATAPADSKLTYTVGDNHCFAPPPPPLTSIGVSKAQYGDVAAVAAKLVDANGVPVGDTDVTFSLGLSKVVATTGDDGIAKAALLIKDKAGKRTLSIVTDDVKTSVPFTVLVEKTALKAVGTSGSVTAVLTDDDKHPVKGQAVTFTSGARKVTAKTNAQGIAKATGFPAGSAVKVVYAGAPGMYSAASASAKA